MKTIKECRLCGSKNITKLFYSHNTHGRHVIDEKEKYQVYRCQDCGLIFLDDIILDQKYYQKYYELGYYDGKEETVGNGLLTGVTKWISKYSVGRKSKMILKDSTLPSKLSILDFGCGDGSFLSALKNKRLQKSGLEINTEGQEICRRKGIKVYGGEISQINFGQEKFDVITTWHVLEHLEDPNAVLQDISKILRKNGKLIIQTPNTDSLGFKLGRENWFHLDSPRHLALYNAKSIMILAERNGFKVAETINEFYDYPLDLFWSVREHKLEILLRLFYPFLKIFSRENLTYILLKK